MDIQVSGHQLDISDAFRTYAQDSLNAVAEKYFSRAIGATVTLSPGPHDSGFICEIVMHVPQGLILKGSGRAAQANLALDAAVTKIEKQLRRYKRRLKDRHTVDLDARAEAFDYNAAYTVFRADGEADEETGDNPVIVAETRVDIPESSVSDAVMMLDLRNTNALLFKNSMTGALNMVYRRDDGNIGWVEPAS